MKEMRLEKLITIQQMYCITLTYYIHIQVWCNVVLMKECVIHKITETVYNKYLR